MKNARFLYFFGIAIIWIVTTVTAFVNKSGCIYPPNLLVKGGFRVTSEIKEKLNIQVACENVPEDWADFTNIGVNCNSVGEIEFVNCTYPQNLSLLDTLHRMNINYSAVIKFKDLRSSLSRQYFRNCSAMELLFEKSNLDVFDLPFDLLYDVLDLRILIIRSINLHRMPVNFLKGWPRNLQKMHIMYTKLPKITKDEFTDLVELRELILFGNKISEIEAGAFDKLSNLVTLDISNNLLHTLPSGIFRHLNALDRLHLSENPFDELPNDLLTGIDNNHLKYFSMIELRGSLKTLPAGFFKNIASLKEVELRDAQLKSLSPDLFSETPELVNLSLRNNSLRNIPVDLFRGFEKLQTLDLSENQIATLPDGIFETLGHLENLYISYNNLTTLTCDIMKGLNVLKALKASHNHLNQINEEFCHSIKSVKTIDFSFNRLTFKPTRNTLNSPNSLFTSCHELENIDFSNNKVSEIIDIRTGENINWSNNNLTKLTVKEIESFHPMRTTINLQHNQISKINLTDLPNAVARFKVDNKPDSDRALNSRNLTVLLGNNPLHCDCNMIDFIRYWRSDHDSELRKYVKLIGDSGDVLDRGMACASPAEFAKRSISSIRPEELSCPLKIDTVGDACNSTCTCREYPAKQVLTLDCSHRNLTRLPAVITNVHDWSIEVNMSYNLLKETPSLTSNPHFAKISSLDLSHNNISTVTIDLFTENLVVLKLHNNSISRLDEQVIKYLKSRRTIHGITLDQNPWQCDCEAHSFLNFVQEKTSTYRLHRVACHGTNNILHEMTIRDICKDAIAIIVGASLLVALFGIAIGILAALYYKYQQEIKVWLYSKQWCLWFVTEDELDKDKKYDAFISFSHKDEDFVEKEIVAKLEDGPKPYKLCLHYRDWLAGEWIPVQISQSVEDSRRTIVVLSPNFLESVWGRMEFRTAHTQALKEGRARVVIILYGEIENVEDLDPELKAYLSLNTYIKWGDPWFWDKLRYALPHRYEPSRRKTRNARIIEDHLIRRTANNGAADAIVKSDVISMSKLANDSAKLLDPFLDDRMAASC